MRLAKVILCVFSILGAWAQRTSQPADIIVLDGDPLKIQGRSACSVCDEGWGGLQVPGPRREVSLSGALT